MKIQKLSTIWSSETGAISLEEQTVHLSKNEDTALLVVKKGESAPCLYGKLYGDPVSNDKFVIGCKYRKNGAWNCFVKIEGEVASFFENYSKKDSFDHTLRLAFFGIGPWGQQHFLAARCVGGRPLVCHLTWPRQAGEQPLYFIANEFKALGIDLASIIAANPLPREDVDDD